jgi:hypothetical protein
MPKSSSPTVPARLPDCGGTHCQNAAIETAINLRPVPFALSLSKGERNRSLSRSWFDTLTTNGLTQWWRGIGSDHIDLQAAMENNLVLIRGIKP